MIATLLAVVVSAYVVGLLVVATHPVLREIAFATRARRAALVASFAAVLGAECVALWLVLS